MFLNAQIFNAITSLKTASLQEDEQRIIRLETKVFACVLEIPEKYMEKNVE